MNEKEKTPLEQIHENLDSIKTELLSRGIGISCMDKRNCVCIECALSEVKRNLSLIAPRTEKTICFTVNGERKGKQVIQEFVEILYIDSEKEDETQKRILNALALDLIQDYKPIK